MADTVTLRVGNPAADNEPIVYVGTPNILNVSLINGTGADISYQKGDTLEAFFPFYFSGDEVSRMNVADISQSGWHARYDSESISQLFEFEDESGNWPSGENFTFSLNNVISNGKPTIDSLQINLTDLSGTNVPTQIEVPLTLNEQNVQTSADLADYLKVNLDNQGNVFVSIESDPLSNTIYLNFKNSGTNPLYQGKSMWSGTPKVTVSFVYGSTSGALAQAAKTGQSSVGSAWDISGKIYVDQTAGWNIANPKISESERTPSWKLAPNKDNLEIIGVDDQSNITFAFTNVISLTPPGHTQMFVQFSGFTQSPETSYNDHLFVLDITKQEPPFTRGLVNFFSSSDSVVALDKPQSHLSVDLRWSMYFVDKVRLITNMPGAQLVQTEPAPNEELPVMLPLRSGYSGESPVNSDHVTVLFPTKITQDTAATFTLEALDRNGGFLNAMQFTVFLAARFFVDNDGKCYPTVFISGQTWMAANLDHQAPGSIFYDHNQGNEETYGRLYTSDMAHSSVPAGWRLPTTDDWNNLLRAGGYDDLIAGGKSGFNAQLGGNGDNLATTNFSELGLGGFYWTSIPDDDSAGNNFFAWFNSDRSSVNTTNSFPRDYFLSVRYVKNS